MFEQFDGNDDLQLREGVAEIEKMMDEPIIILRFNTQGGSPNNFGDAPKPSYTQFSSYATIKTMDVNAKYQAAGIMVAGDVILEMRDGVREADDANNGSHPGDRVIFRGKQYRLVQRQIPVTIGDDIFYETHLRRVNDPSDTVVS